MKNYRSLDAHRYHKAGHVHVIKHLTTKKGFTVMRANVNPSFRQASNPHKPWVCIDKEGVVQCGHCTCMAG